MLALAARCTLVKLSDEDAEVLTRATTRTTSPARCSAASAPELVLLTRGAGGATAFTGTTTR